MMNSNTIIIKQKRQRVRGRPGENPGQKLAGYSKVNRTDEYEKHLEDYEIAKDLKLCLREIILSKKTDGCSQDDEHHSKNFFLN